MINPLTSRILRVLPRLEAVLAVLLTAMAVCLHVYLARNVGGLWRDEVVSVEVANLPTWGELWRYLEFDSYPGLFHVVLRSWHALWPDGGDTALRLLGGGIGVGLLAAFWVSQRALGAPWPLFTLAFVGLNPLVIRYGDSMRAYGLGAALAILALTAVWQLSKPGRLRPGRVLLAVAVAILSVQCIYYNAVLLLASCLAGAAVAAGRGDYRRAAVVLGVGAPAAASLIPYLPIVQRVKVWSFMLEMKVNPAWLWARIADVTGSPEPLGVWVWPVLFAATVGAAGVWLVRRGRPAAVATDGVEGEPVTPAGPRVLFCTVALLAGTLGYVGFLLLLSFHTQPWYFIALLAYAAVCLDGIVNALPLRGNPLRIARLVLVLLFAGSTLGPALALLRVRHTNLDAVAARLHALVEPNDLVLLTRWECAISLERYYHGAGAAPLLTVPPLDDHRVHRYDLVLAHMMATDPIAPVFTALETTLKAGHRVWVVGPLISSEPGKAPPTLPPARKTAAGWQIGPFYQVWTVQTCDFLRQHALGGRPVPVAVPQPVSDYEDISLAVVQGWREPAVAAPTPASP